jgi:hypothetical protein
VAALTTISAFILLELWQLKFLTLEVRTYALFVFATTLAIYVSLRAITCPHWVNWVWTAAAYCLLVNSHTFGIIYVVSIATCAIAAALIDDDIMLARNAGLAALPAAVMFISWLPVMHYQAQLGSWITQPNLEQLLRSTYLTGHTRLLLAPAILAALVALRVRKYSSNDISSQT